LLKLQKFLDNTENFLLVLAAFLLPTQLGKHFWPESSFIYSLKIDYLSPTVYFWDLLVLALLAVAGIRAMLGAYGTSINRRYGAVLIMFYASVIPSFINAVNIDAAIVQFKDLLFAGLFSLYVASRDFGKISRFLFLGLILSFVFICLLAVYQFLAGRSLGLWVLGERDFSVTTPLVAKFNYYDKVFLRPYATFSHPNILGGFLIVLLPLVAYWFVYYLKRSPLVLTMLGSVTVLITFSRPALVLLGIGLLVIYRKYWKLILIGAVLLSPIIAVRFISVFTFDTLAILRRQELADYSLELFLNNPFTGAGLNNFINLLAMDRVLVGTSRFLQPVHNIFLLLLSETGLLGLIGFMAIIFTGIYSNLRKRSRLSTVLIGCLLSIIFLGFFDHYFLTLPQGQRILFLVLGLSFIKGSANIG
jgi:O-antigen ligase